MDSESVNNTDMQRKNKPIHRWAKGVSGNPAGRPKKGLLIADAIREVGEANDREKIKQLAEVIWRLACGGDMSAIKEISDRMDGKPKITAEVATEERVVVVGLPPGVDCDDL